MKILLLASIFFALTLSGNAQVSFGVNTGFNLPDVYTTEEVGPVPNTSIGFGYHLGGILEIAFTNYFFIQPGIMFTTKGFQFDEGTHSQSVTCTLDYIEVPVNAMFKITSGTLKYLIYGGPYAAYGLAGIAAGASAISYTSTEQISFGKNGNELRPFDLGFNIGTGIEVNRIQYIVQFGLGLRNMSNSPGETINNYVFGISGIYLIGGR